MYDAIYTCDHCGEDIVVPIDVSQGSRQDYVEDCPVCCSPVVLHVSQTKDGEFDIRAECEQDRY